MRRRELPAHKALLRLQHWAACGAPAALRAPGGGAAQLVNAALHAVAGRAGRLADPRMRSLRSVSHLASLWAGDRSSYKYKGRQVRPSHLRASSSYCNCSLQTWRCACAACMLDC